MTMIRRWRLPVLIALMFLVLAWLIRRVSPEVSDFIRIANGFVLVVLLVWVIQRVLRYEDHLQAHRKDILDLMKRSEADRSEAVSTLMQRTEDIAADLATTAERKAEEVLKANDERHKAIKQTVETATSALSQKIDQVIKQTDGDPRKEGAS